MRILVIGATGRLGAMLRWAWADEPRLAVSWQCRGPMGSGRDRGADWVRFDPLTEPQALLAACEATEVVLNLAGVTPASGRDLALNTDLACAVARAANRAERPHLLSSSAAVYGSAGGICRESDKVAPSAAYGIEKHRMEQGALALGGRLTCLRIGNVAGADQILGQLGAETPALQLDQFADGRTPARSYIGPASLARVLGDLAWVAGKGSALPKILNVAAPGMVEMGALLDAVPHPWRPRSAPETAIAEVALDISVLSRFTQLDPEAGQARALVGEWRAFRAAMAEQR